jgi:Domain of unknown function (DUF4389)
MYPVRYEADYFENPNRWITGFRLILAIPWFIVASVYITAAFIVAFLAWFAIAFTTRYPQGLHNFNAGILRFLGRANAFFYLQTDQWPSFGFDQDPSYPIRVDTDPPLERYSRAKTIFRLILGIPVMFMIYLIASLYPIVSVVAWFHIVFTGRTSAGTHNVLTYGLAYQLRVTAYFLLMTETFPPISDQAPAANLRPGAAAGAPTGAAEKA